LVLYPKGTVFELTNAEVVEISSYHEDGMYQVTETSGISNLQAKAFRLVVATDIKRILTVLCSEIVPHEKQLKSPIRLKVDF